MPKSFYSLFENSHDNISKKFEVFNADTLANSNKRLSELQNVLNKFDKTRNIELIQRAIGDVDSGKENEPSDNEQVTTTTNETGAVRKSTRTKRTTKKVLKEVKTERPSQILEEPVDEVDKQQMPAPAKLPLKAKRIKQEKISEKSTRVTRSTRNTVSTTRNDSDVILQQPEVPIIELSDDEKSFESTNSKKPAKSTRTKTRNKTEVKVKQERISEVSTRSTRTKTRNQNKEIKTKRDRSESGETKTAITKKSKSNSPNASAKTVFEDALEQLPAISNETFVSQPNAEKIQPDATFVASKPANETFVANETFAVKKTDQTYAIKPHDNLLTDDESDEKSKPNKAIFSPYVKTPLRQKVEAFEKLNKKPQIPKLIAKTTTPRVTPNKKISVPTKMMSANKTRSNSEESLSALKASANEFRERLKKQKEKEEEAIKKREAMLQLQAEEKRKKREDKHLKAQQVREAREKEKQRLIELQLQKEEERKEERKRQLQARMMKEAEEKRLMAKKLKAVNSHVHVVQNKQFQDEVPIYMREETPLLQCDDCYDSDDPDYGKVKNRTAAWATSTELRKQELVQLSLKKLRNNFWSRQVQTVDLIEIFQRIDSRKLKRTSSAVWKNAPRYTMIPNLNDYSIMEEDF